MIEMVVSAYVACSSHELNRARSAMRMLESAGFSMAYDWTLDVEQFGSDGRAQEQALSDHDLAFLAEKDMAAVERAHVVLVLWPTTPSCGAYVELGAAIMRARLKDGLVVVAGGDSIWHSWIRRRGHCRTFATDQDAIEYGCHYFDKPVGNVRVFDRDAGT